MLITNPASTKRCSNPDCDVMTVMAFDQTTNQPARVHCGTRRVECPKKGDRP